MDARHRAALTLLKSLSLDPDRRELGERIFVYVQRLINTMPEPDAWSAVPDSTGASLLVLSGKCFFTVRVVVSGQDRMYELSVTSRGLDPAREMAYVMWGEDADSDRGHWGTPTKWAFKPKEADSSDPGFEIEGFICNEHGPDRSEQLARGIADVLGWEVEVS